MEKTINIFGKEIKINTKAVIITVEKSTEGVVTLIANHQNGVIESAPIFTTKDYGKTADEFIREFNKVNYVATNDERGIFDCNSVD